MPEEPATSGGSGAANDELPEIPYEEIVWLSTPKAADRLGITTRTLYRFIDRGDLPAYRFGRVIRLRLADVDRFIDACLVEPGSLEHLYPEARPGDSDGEPGDEESEADDDD